MNGHYLYLIEEGVTGPDVPIDLANGLVAVQDGVAVIATGIHSGVINFRGEVHDVEPDLDTAEWDDVAEVSIDLEEPTLFISAPDGRSNPEADSLSVGPAGSYRMRAHVRGRDEAPDAVSTVPTESYLVQIWPAPPAASTTNKMTDHYGAQVRRLNS